MRNQESQGPVEAQRVAWGRLSGAGSMKTLSLQRDPDGFFLWHPDYAPWIVGRHSLGANPNDRAFFDPNTGESFLLEPPPTFPETSSSFSAVPTAAARTRSALRYTSSMLLPRTTRYSRAPTPKRRTYSRTSQCSLPRHRG